MPSFAVLALSLADFEALARRAFDELPDEVRAACAGLAIRVDAVHQIISGGSPHQVLVPER